MTGTGPDAQPPAATQQGTTTARLDWGRYRLRHPWPLDCLVQGGTRGLVVVRGSNDHYTTAFIEAFPRDPSTFLRGEGATMGDAEDAAWAQYQRVLTCPGANGDGSGGHQYEPRGYRNGAGFCRHCGLFTSGVFTPEQLGLHCAECGTPTYFAAHGADVYCEQHNPERDQLEALRAQLDRDDEEVRRDPAAFDSTLTDLLEHLADPARQEPR